MDQPADIQRVVPKGGFFSQKMQRIARQNPPLPTMLAGGGQNQERNRRVRLGEGVRALPQGRRKSDEWGAANHCESFNLDLPSPVGHQATGGDAYSPFALADETPTAVSLTGVTAAAKTPGWSWPLVLLMVSIVGLVFYRGKR